MKALENFTNADKGKAIFELFPRHIPKLIKELQAHCQDIVKNRHAIESNWPENHLVTADFWVDTADDTDDIIELKYKLLCRNMKFFLFEFFETPRFVVVMDFIQRYSIDRINDERYELAVKLFFGE
ncbi:hypothetical protein [Chitinophaga filiformis]|nr:hypothetical protein [Chitinophaga filiformis]